MSVVRVSVFAHVVGPLLHNHRVITKCTRGRGILPAGVGDQRALRQTGVGGYASAYFFSVVFIVCFGVGTCYLPFKEATSIFLVGTSGGVCGRVPISGASTQKNAQTKALGVTVIMLVWLAITTPFMEVLLVMGTACSLAEPVWPCLIGTWWRFFLIGLFKSEFMPSIALFSSNGTIGMPRTPTPFLFREYSREADLWLPPFFGLDLPLALSIVFIFPGEPDRI